MSEWSQEHECSGPEEAGMSHGTDPCETSSHTEEVSGTAEDVHKLLGLVMHLLDATCKLLEELLPIGGGAE